MAVNEAPTSDRPKELAPRLLAAVVRGRLLRELRRAVRRTLVARARLRAATRGDELALTRAVVDELPNVGWTAAPDGSSEFMSRRWYEYTGTTSDQATGRAWHEMYHPDQRPAVLAAWQRSVATGKGFEIEAQIRGADGTYRWFLVRARPVRDRDGRLIRWIGISVDVDEQHRLREELETQSRLTRAITDNASGALFLTDASERCTFMNPAAEKMTGFSMEEVVASGKPLHDVIHHLRPDGRPYPIEECPIDRALPTRAREQGVDVFVHKDGHFYPVGFTASPIVAGGRSTGTVLEVTDLSAVESREAWLLAVVEGSPVGIALYDRSLRFLQVNEALARIGGVPADAHLGRPLREVYPSLPDDLEAQYRRVIATAEAVIEYDVSGVVPSRRGPSDDERPRHFQVSIYPILVRGYVEGVVGMIQDVTQRRREDQRRALVVKASELFASSLDLERTFESIVDLFVPECADWASVFVRRDDGGIELVATTHSKPGAAARFRDLFVHASADAQSDSHVSEAFRTEQSVLIEDVAGALEADDGAGTLRPWLELLRRDFDAVSALALPMRVHGHTIGALSLGSRTAARRFNPDEVPFFEEVARRGASAIENARLFELANRERRRADEANRAKDEFLAVVSHELRTPLNAVLGWSRMLSTDVVTPERRRRALEIIERNALAQAQLVEDLLDVSRIVTGKLRLELQSFAVTDVVRAAVENATPAADAKGVSLVTRLDEAPAMIGDPTRIQQAIWNLLSNAVKFTPRGGEITVTCVERGGKVVLTVSDTGEGIEPQFVPHVFERFQQADMRSTRRHGGLGLGLAIVRHIAELHGGTVEASSAGRGHGSTFRVEIPLAPAKGPAALTGAPRELARPPVDRLPGAAGDTIRGLKLLVVDDEEDARTLLSEMLSESGAIVSTADSVKQALAAFDESRPDVLVSDIGMPGEDGYDLIERLRARPAAEGGKVPAVALTAYARSEDRTKALLTGFDAHVVKPVDLEELLRVIARVARVPR
jgi:PAS domain S-box-containing protein